MTIKKFGMGDPYSLWHFTLPRPDLNGFPFTLLDYSTEKKVSYHQVFIDTLQILKKHQLFFIDRVDSFNFSDKTKFTELFQIYSHEDDSSIDFMRKFLLSNIDDLYDFDIYGKTLININGNLQSFDGVFKLSYTSWDSITILNYSDCWVPIDFDSEPQLDTAQNNYPRLMDALQEISELSEFLKSPKDDDEGTFPLNRCGLNLFIPDGLFDNSLFSNSYYSEEKKAFIDSFLWSNRFKFSKPIDPTGHNLN